MLTRTIRLYKQHNKDERKLIIDCITMKLALMKYCKVNKFVMYDILENTNPLILVERDNSIIIKDIHAAPLLRMIEKRKEELFSPMRAPAVATSNN